MIGPIPPITPGVGGPTLTPRVAGSAGSDLTDAFAQALDTVSASHAQADQLALGAATGDLSAVHDYTIAATEAQLLTQLTVEVRNRAIEAFNDIMRMQV